jgi:hypothetical protein
MNYAIEISGISENPLEQMTQLGILVIKGSFTQDLKSSALEKCVKLCAKYYYNYYLQKINLDEIPDWLFSYFSKQNIVGHLADFQSLTFRVLI